MMELITILWQNYGLVGLFSGGFLWLLWRTHKKCEKELQSNREEYEKRITNLEAKVETLHGDQLRAHKEMIEDYILLLQKNSEVLTQLTYCINSVNDTMKRLESSR